MTKRTLPPLNILLEEGSNYDDLNTDLQNSITKLNEELQLLNQAPLLISSDP
jgi:hypothetical protein